MKYIIILILIHSAFNNLYAQKNVILNEVISGKVIDESTKAPIEYAAITVYPIGSDKPVNGIITKNWGKYLRDNFR